MNSAHPATILIIEDETDIRLLYASYLSEKGLNVEQAQDGEIGLEKIKSIDWDVLLLDIILPNKDGVGILKEISVNKDLKKGAILLLTNLSNENIIEEAFSNGADGYIIKSEITPDDLYSEVKKYLKPKSENPESTQ